MKPMMITLLGALALSASSEAGQIPEKAALSLPVSGVAARIGHANERSVTLPKQAQDSAQVPTGMIAFFTAAACPAGWTDAASAQGRVLVGVTNAADREDIGEPLGDRMVPRHEHEASAESERRGRQAAPSVSFPPDTAAEFIQVLQFRDRTWPADSQIPFFQLVVCRKG